MPSRLTPSEEDFQPCFAKAKFNFVGKNNDELCFKKGDLISVSQKTEEGWWEGTLSGKTGWFPSNYVTEVCNNVEGVTVRPKSPMVGKESSNVGSSKNCESSEDERYIYRRIIIEDFVDSERAHIDELETLVKSFLSPLREERILSDKDFLKVFCNIDKLLECQRELLLTLEHCVRKNSRSQKIGGLFLKMAPKFKDLLRTYCDNHPLVVEIVAKNRDALMKFMNKSNSDLMGLITGLSSPFRRFEKYPNFLQELERNTEENHSDRGDTQRAIAVYRDLRNFCNDCRKQKELQMELLSGNITDWDGPAFSTMGDIMYMKSVPVKFGEHEFHENLVILFPTLLLILQVSHQLNSYLFKKKVHPIGIRVKKQTDASLTSSEPNHCVLMHHHVITLYSLKTEDKNNQTNILSILFSNNEDSTKFLQCLQSVEGFLLDDTCNNLAPPISSASPRKYISSVQNHEVAPSAKIHISDMPSPGYAEMVTKKNTSLSNMRPSTSGAIATADGSRKGIPPRTKTVDNFPASGASLANNYCSHHISPPRRPLLAPKRFSGYCLRPLTSHRLQNVKIPFEKTTSDDKVKLRKKDSLPSTSINQDEAEIFKVVEAYCNGAAPLTSKGRNFRKQSESPQLLVAEEEKLFVEEWVGDELIVQEKTLVDTVYSLKDQMNGVKQEIARLSELLLEEQKARKKSDELLRRFLISQRRSTPRIAPSRSSSEQAKSHDGSSQSTSHPKEA